MFFRHVNIILSYISIKLFCIKKLTYFISIAGGAAGLCSAAAENPTAAGPHTPQSPPSWKGSGCAVPAASGSADTAPGAAPAVPPAARHPPGQKAASSHRGTAPRYKYAAPWW